MAAVNELPQRFHVPQNGAREYLLEDRCKADFCFKIKPQGCLFIEDDDAQRASSNLVKYWIWCAAHRENRPVHVIHIVSPKRSAYVKNVQFLGKRMEESIPDFKYHLISIESWHAPDEVWLPDFRRCLKQIDGMIN